MSNMDLADLLKAIVNKTVEHIGGSFGVVNKVESDDNLAHDICWIQPDDGSPEVPAKLHKGQKPTKGSRVAFISTHIDTVEDDDYTLIHIFDYDEHLMKANERVLLEVDKNKITVIKDKMYLGYENPDKAEENPAVLGKELIEELNKIKNAINKHTHIVPTMMGSQMSQNYQTSLGGFTEDDFNSIKSTKVFVDKGERA